VLDARGLFDDEIRQTWPQWSVDRYLGKRRGPPSTREERDRLLSQAEVILGGWPFPLDLRARAPRLKWFHQRPAGASNLRRGDLWGSDVTVTTSRGYGNTRAMAEYVLACFFHFARGLHRANRDRQRQAFEHGAYRPVLDRRQDRLRCRRRRHRTGGRSSVRRRRNARRRNTPARFAQRRVARGIQPAREP
jgi:phosphoglycerate dehydrogenase-like enzyme